ncbi:MAG: DUF4105 domain-containing protein [Paludibacter sp.]|nr:DUF4105 domain-containing protein [Paludibacter sp.]
MKNKSFLFILILTLISCISVNSQTIRVTDSTQISVVTCSPYQSEVYAKFGHAGMRVFDASQNVDLLFNWGIFSFDTGNFLAKFIIGHTDYALGVVETELFLEEYSQRGSSVTEQVLNLNLTEKNALIDLLLENYKPENRKYRYNFIFDNCATRPLNLVSDAVNRSFEYIIFPNPERDLLTYRSLIAQYAGKNTWLMFGIDLVFGANADVIPTEIQSQFLPENLKEEFYDAKIVEKNKSERNLVLKQNYLVQQTGEKFNPNAQEISFPFLFFLAILLIRIFCFVREMKFLGKKFVKIDSLLLIAAGLIGCIAFFLTFISVHPLVGRNFNILWLMPLNVVVGVLIWFKSKRKILFFYFLIYILLILISLGVYAAQIQAINYACVPIILTMMLISMSWIIRCRRAFSPKKSFWKIF